jgi:hypothetical protein
MGRLPKDFWDNERSTGALSSSQVSKNVARPVLRQSYPTLKLVYAS